MIAALVISISFSASLFFLVSSDEQQYIVAQNTSDVKVTDGVQNFTLNLAVGTLIGGNPETSVIMTEARAIPVMQATNITFPVDTEIDCDPPPGYPNPCTPYS